MSIYIQDWAMISALGENAENTRKHLSQGSIPNLKNTQIGEHHLQCMTLDIPEKWSPNNFSDYNSRNNRLLFQCFETLSEQSRTLVDKTSNHRVGIVMGTSTSGILEAENGYKSEAKFNKWSDTYHYHQHEFGSPSDFLSKFLNSSGPSLTISTACSSSAKAFGVAARWLQQDLCDLVIVGGCDTICDMTLLGFNSLGAYSKGRCSPYSIDRDGIHIGEAAALFILSKEDAQLKLSGFGESTDAHHISAPDPEGQGASLAIQAALSSSGLDSSQIQYINLHGTGTQLNDSMEAKALRKCFSKIPPSSSTKALTGHTLGAAGALEAAISLIAISHPTALYPIHHSENPIDPAFSDMIFSDKDFISTHCPKISMSNSFAFGGSNCCLIFESMNK